MKPLHIEFAPRSLQRSVMRTPFTSWLAIIIAVAIWGGIVLKAISLHRQQAATELILQNVTKTRQARLNAIAARNAAARIPVFSEAQAKSVNAAIAQLNLPWRDLFDAIEAATPSTIALLSIEPDAKKQIIKTTAEAKNSNAMIAYVEQLKKEPLFTSVQLSKHEINEQDSNKPIRFQLEAQWSEIAP